MSLGQHKRGFGGELDFLQQNLLYLDGGIHSCHYSLTNISHYSPISHAFSCLCIPSAPLILSEMPFQPSSFIRISFVLKNQMDFEFLSWVFSQLPWVSFPCADGALALSYHGTCPKLDWAWALSGGDFSHTAPGSCFWRIWFYRSWVAFRNQHYLKSAPT